MKIVAATNNAHKLDEIRAILAEINIEVLSLKDVNVEVEVEENGQTFEENALIKAREICNLTQQPTLADDSGLEVEALGGEPGVYSARYSGATGMDKDKQNNQKLIEKMKNIPQENRAARFCSAIAAVFPDGREIVAKGYVYGHIGREEKGAHGFGYDPLFIVEGTEGKTMAELTPAEKNKISHRANALKAFSMKIKEILR